MSPPLAGAVAVAVEYRPASIQTLGKEGGSHINTRYTVDKAVLAAHKNLFNPESRQVGQSSCGQLSPLAAFQCSILVHSMIETKIDQTNT